MAHRKPQNGSFSNAAEAAANDTAEVPFGKVLGVAPAGVPAFSNGSDDHFSGVVSLAPASRPGYEVELGYEWQCVEYARRYLAMTRGLWLKSVPVAEQIWKHQDALDMRTGQHQPLRRCPNGSTDIPMVGDLLVWRRAHDVPFGHVAAIVEVGEGFVRIAEQNLSFVSWEGKDYARELKMRVDSVAPSGSSGCTTPQAKRLPAGDESLNNSIAGVSGGLCSYTIIDEDPILGWMRPECPFLSFSETDLPDAFRHTLSQGSLRRVSIDRDPSLAWLDTTQPTDFFLHRSLVGADAPKDAVAPEAEVPDGYYVFNYDMFMRVREASADLHQKCLQATRHVLNLDNREEILAQQFNFPPELVPLMMKSLRHTAPLTGRFDFGVDEEGRIAMMEYNSDSSAALLECADTQDKWARHAGVDEGHSTGSFMTAKLQRYWQSFIRSRAPRAPGQPSNVPQCIHFMVDDDDEERYTAITVMNAAKAAGLNCKLVVKLVGFRYAEDPKTKDIFIVDAEGTPVTFVWKTWSWDTVLKDYYAVKRAERCRRCPQSDAAECDKEGCEEGSSAESPASPSPDTQTGTESLVGKRPTLSAMLLNDNIEVLEPLWKVVAGSKALLPYLHELNPDHPNLVAASFDITDELLAGPYLSKPVHGRAGQNISMYNAGERPKDTPGTATPQPSFGTSEPTTPQSTTTNNSFSGGRFVDSLMVYQRRIKLRKFGNYYPIVCGWIVEGDFAGIVIREDTSKITKLGSIVAPARVLRE